MFNWQSWLNMTIEVLEASDGKRGALVISERIGISERLVYSLRSGTRPFTWETKRQFAAEFPELWPVLRREMGMPKEAADATGP